MPPKRLFVDASIMFSFFKADSVRRHVMEALLNDGCELVSPEYALSELKSDKAKIKNFSGISEAEFSLLTSLLEKSVKTAPKGEYDDFMAEANTISPHGEGTKDDPYFALALAKNCTVWSDEKAFKKQGKVKVFSTEELLDELGTE